MKLLYIDDYGPDGKRFRVWREEWSGDTFNLIPAAQFSRFRAAVATLNEFGFVTTLEEHSDD